jgi:hypothetical protein
MKPTIGLAVFMSIAGALGAASCSPSDGSSCVMGQSVSCSEDKLPVVAVDCDFCCSRAEDPCTPGAVAFPCCSGICQSGKCTCGTDGAPCRDSFDCCSGFCTNRTCVRQACLASKECPTGKECAPGQFQQGGVDLGQSVGACLSSSGAGCLASTDCVSGACDAGLCN